MNHSSEACYELVILGCWQCLHRHVPDLFFNFENYRESADEAFLYWLILAFLLGSGVSWAIQNRKWIWKKPMTERPLKEMSVAELLGRLLLFPIWIAECYYKRKKTLRAQATQQSFDQSEQLRKSAAEQEDARVKQQASHEAAEREAVRYRCQLAYDKHSHLLQGKFLRREIGQVFRAVYER